MKRKGDKFQELKVRMVMKLKKLSHCAAVKEIARMDAERRKVAEEKAAEMERMKEECEALCRPRGRTAKIRRSDGDRLMSAKEFFGGI